MGIRTAICKPANHIGKVLDRHHRWDDIELEPSTHMSDYALTICFERMMIRGVMN